MIHLMIQELYWNSDTSRANAQPVTEEIKPSNFHEGMVCWFKWDTRRRTLEYLSESDRGPSRNLPFDGDFERGCTTTLLYCEKDGYSSIPYNPVQDNTWPHWWSLGFKIQERDLYTIQRDDETYSTKRIKGNRSGWFHLFRNTQHDMGGAVSSEEPFLTGAASLVWALAAFRFDAGTLSGQLPTAVMRDGNLQVRYGEEDCPSGRMSQRALAVEIWVPKGATVPAPRLC